MPLRDKGQEEETKIEDKDWMKERVQRMRGLWELWRVREYANCGQGKEERQG